jgi:hypothetical protein
VITRAAIDGSRVCQRHTQLVTQRYLARTKPIPLKRPDRRLGMPSNLVGFRCSLSTDQPVRCGTRGSMLGRYRADEYGLPVVQRWPLSPGRQCPAGEGQERQQSPVVRVAVGVRTSHSARRLGRSPSVLAWLTRACHCAEQVIDQVPDETERLGRFPQCCSRPALKPPARAPVISEPVHRARRRRH